MSHAMTPCAGRSAMRHDPATGAIVVMLRSLKMHGMAQAVTDLMAQGAPAFEAAVPILSQLLKAETAEREVSSVAYHLQAPRHPASREPHRQSIGKAQRVSERVNHGGRPP